MHPRMVDALAAASFCRPAAPLPDPYAQWRELWKACDSARRGIDPDADGPDYLSMPF
jgi:hypothetical protein